MKTTTKEERMEIVNQIMSEIANRGRRFFYDKESGEISKFLLTGQKQKRLWYFESRTHKNINTYASNYRKDDHFGWGGTLWSLVHEFREFIITGNYSNGKQGYGGLYGSGWGYDEEDMNQIITVAKNLGYLK